MTRAPAYTVEVRDAVPEDWESVWPIVAAVVRAGDTYAYDPAMTSEQGRALWMERPPGRTSVAETGGRVVGTAKMGPNRPGPGSHVGTASFMVAPTGRGLGVGRALAEDTVAWHRAEGYAAIQFNAVVETNHAAVGLWRSLGFTVVGTVPRAFEHPQHGRVGLHVMHLSLEVAHNPGWSVDVDGTVHLG